MTSSSTARRPLHVGMLVVSQYESDPRVRRQAEALVARGDRVTVLALHADGRPRVDEVEGVAVVHLPTKKYRGASAKAYLSLYGGFLARALAWLVRHPREFDVLMAHSMPEVIAFAGVVQRICGTPVVVDVHDLTSNLFASKFADRKAMMAAIRFSERAAFRFSKEVITVHEPYADLVRGMTKRPVNVVMNGPDEKIFAPGPPRTWDPSGEVVFGYHGLIAPRHGLVATVEALAKLRDELPGARFLVRGAGDGLAELRERVAALGLTEAVDLPARLLALPEIVEVLRRVHIGVVPSQLDPWTAEVLPTKLLEYATLGIPVITFSNPVIRRYFPAEAVTYVDPASPENLRTAMLALARDPAAAATQALRASEVVAELSWSRQREGFFEVIDRVARRRG